ncbi:glycosyltransferase family 1 protein [Streptomyces sp. HNM0575]|uniref:glycosyltransferase n=1 Tax=Streptomyces sp. HNM0575 TaxID=2716338 RepID=UPI00145E9664|nr:glycosyltransferase [Streptomyces sp. HNM0575]NLU76610.1 glycosyltransferase family 1 protein [Streptomyces sp. HNM0575]
MSASQQPILFVGLPESGLLNSMLVLVEELSRQGVEDLWFATDEPRRSDVEALSVGSTVDFSSLGEIVPQMSSVTWDDETYRRVTQRSRFKARRAVIEQTFAPELRVEKYRRLEEAVEKIQPALMVVESMCQYGCELAITKKIPYVLSVPFVISNVLTSTVPVGRSYAPKDFPVPHSGLPHEMNLRQRLANRLFKWRTLAMFLSSAMRERNARDAQVREELGIDPASNSLLARVDSAEMVLCYSVPELDYPLPVPDSVRMVGAMVPPLPQSEPGELTEWLDAHESVVYMGFGTITRLTRDQVGALVEVARRLEGEHHVLWKLPEDQQQWLPPAGELPGNLRVESWVPSQLDVLAHEHVSAFFTHGGGNAYHEGVYFGKPMVMRPLWVDCYDQAVRAQDFGVGLTLDKPRTVDPDDVVDKLTRVMGEPSFRENAERLGRLQREAGGRERAAELIRSLPAASGQEGE